MLWAYRYTSRPWQLRLDVARRRPRVDVSDYTAVAVTARQAVLRSLLSAEVTGAPILSLSVRLPDSLRVSQVRVPPGAEWFVGRDGRGQRLKVDLGGPALGKLDLAVSGTLARDAAQADFAVPGVVVEEAQLEHGQLAVYLDDDLQAMLTRQIGATVDRSGRAAARAYSLTAIGRSATPSSTIRRQRTCGCGWPPLPRWPAPK